MACQQGALANPRLLQLGHLGCQIASKGMGFRVIGIDSARKKDLVLECGAEVFIDHHEGDSEEKVRRATKGLGAQAVVVLTASNEAYASGMNMLRFGGTLVVVGLPEGDMKPIATAFPSMIVTKALKIVGSTVGDRRDAVETLAFAERGIMKTHFETAKMEELTDIFERMSRHETKGGRIVLELS